MLLLLRRVNGALGILLSVLICLIVFILLLRNALNLMFCTLFLLLNGVCLILLGNLLFGFVLLQSLVILYPLLLKPHLRLRGLNINALLMLFWAVWQNV